MDGVEEQVANLLMAQDERRAGIEQLAEMITAYYRALIDSGIVSEELASLLVLQCQASLLAQIGERNRDDNERRFLGTGVGACDQYHLDSATSSNFGASTACGGFGESHKTSGGQMNIDEMPAGDEPDVLKKATAPIGELLDCLPDNHKWKGDDTWKWCWEELSDDAQDRVAKVRRKAVMLLSEVEKAQKGSRGPDGH